MEYPRCVCHCQYRSRAYCRQDEILPVPVEAGIGKNDGDIEPKSEDLETGLSRLVGSYTFTTDRGEDDSIVVGADPSLQEDPRV